MARDALEIRRDPPVAIVTGASSGIGEATAERLAGAGFRVALAARREKLLEALAQRIRAAGGKALCIATDLADEAATSQLVEQTQKAFGRIDVLVNNAGFSLAAAIEQLTRAELRRTFEVNLLAGLQLAGEVIPVMRAQGGGRIILIGSLAARVPAPLAVPYAATKAALEAAADGLRLEVAAWGIDVSLIIAGFVDTPTFDNARRAGAHLRDDPTNPYRQLMFDLDAFASSQLERALEPADVARVVVAAATARRPRARYFVPFSARLQSGFMRSLPVRWRDRILARIYKLPPRPGPPLSE
jgi:short-subunit dehydrogenase